jgi:Deoxyribodipyrimidine photolyase
LRDLDKQLSSLGAHLVILVGNAVDIFEGINNEYQVNKIFSYQETWNLWTYNRDKAVKLWATNNKVEWIEKPKNGVIRNLDYRNGWSRRWYSAMSTPLTKVPSRIKSFKIEGDIIPDALNLNFSTYQPLSSQSATRSEAVNTLNSFLNYRGHNYTFEMSSPVTAEESCSRISPYLAFGQISVREAFQITENRTKEIRGIDTKFSKSLKSFSSRLRWHCHLFKSLKTSTSI